MEGGREGGERSGLRVGRFRGCGGIRGVNP